MPQITSSKLEPSIPVIVPSKNLSPSAKTAMLRRLLQVDEDRRGGLAVVDCVAGEDSRQKIEPLAIREGKSPRWRRSGPHRAAGCPR